MLQVTKQSYWKNVNPVGAVGDLLAVIREAGENRWRIGFLSVATTSLLFWALTHESWRMPPPRPTVTYINSWPTDRSAAETKAFTAENQKWKDDRAAEQAAREEEGKRLYKALGRATGMDVDKIEAEAKAEASAAAAAEAKAAADSVAPEQQAPVAPQ